MVTFNDPCSVQGVQRSLEIREHWMKWRHYWLLHHFTSIKYSNFIKWYLTYLLLVSRTRDGNSQFYHGRVSTATGTALIFISLSMLPVLCTSQEVACDATFATLPLLFSQMFTVHVSAYTYVSAILSFNCHFCVSIIFTIFVPLDVSISLRPDDRKNGSVIHFSAGTYN
jgi:hypothetical protein